MKVTWPKIAFSLPWLLILGWVMVTDFRDGDAEAEVFVLGALTITSMPISLVFMGLIMLMDFVVSHELLGPNFSEIWLSSSFLSGDKETWFKLKFFLWWLATFSGAFWQWFYLAPRVLRPLRPWMMEGDDER
jgi:hypothetical protein